MKILVEAEGLDLDTCLEDYIRKTVVFAISYYGLQGVHVRLDRHSEGPSLPYVRCGLRAETEDRQWISSGATGADVCEAVQEASSLLEVALYRPPLSRCAETPERGAASEPRVRRDHHGAGSDPVRSSRIWNVSTTPVQPGTRRPRISPRQSADRAC